jgi:hypothetical protein
MELPVYECPADPCTFVATSKERATVVDLATQHIEGDCCPGIPDEPIDETIEPLSIDANDTNTQTHKTVKYLSALDSE